MIKIVYSPKFAKQYKRLSARIQDLAEEKERTFIVCPFDQQLKTHKLHGSLADCYAFSINYKYRIVFEFQSENTVIFHAIGGHDVYE